MPVPRVSVEKLGAKAQQAAGGHQEVEPHPARPVVGHLIHAPLARRERLDHGAGVVLGHVDRDPFDRLAAAPVDLAGHHSRLSDGQLVALAPHQLDEHGQLQLAAALHLPHVGPLGVQHAQRHVSDQLAVEPVLEHAGGQLRPALAGHRRCVGADSHRERRLVDGDQRQRMRVVGVGDRLADHDLLDPGDGDHVARSRLLGRHAFEALGDLQLGELGVHQRAVGAAPCHLLAAADRALLDAAQRQPAEIGRRVEVGHPRLQRRPVVVAGRRYVLEDQFEQRLQRCSRGALGERRLTRLGIGVADREIDLVLGGVQIEEQLVDLVHDLGDARVGAVDLVHHQDHRQPRLQRLAQYEAGLRQRPLRRVDQEQHPVDHGQTTFDLAAEIGVAGGVDDVDLGVAVAAGRVLREDRDASLALEAGVEYPVDDLGMFGEGARLAEERIDERRLAVVDVGNDRDIANVVAESVWAAGTGHGRAGW